MLQTDEGMLQTNEGMLQTSQGMLQTIRVCCRLVRVSCRLVRVCRNSILQVSFKKRAKLAVCRQSEKKTLPVS